MSEETPIEPKAKVLFDPTKIRFVPIDDVIPNEYNPKDKQTPEYLTIKNGIEKKGLRGVIYVRWKEKINDRQTYEIVDGEQRWTACKELGIKEIPIYDFEDMPVSEAKQMTVWYEQQVPFNELKLADLIKDIVTNVPDYHLPYTKEQIEEYLKMSDFSWEQYNGEMLEMQEQNGQINMEVDSEFLKKLKQWIAENEPKEGRGGDHKRKMVIVGTTKIKVLEDAMQIIKHALSTAMIQNDIKDEARALELICADYLSATGFDVAKKEEVEPTPDEAADEYQH